MILSLVLSLVSLSVSLFVFIYYFFNFRKRLNEIEYPYEVEERILELLGKFKHVASIKLEMLEKKVDELKGLIKEANDSYASLSVLLTDLNKIAYEIDKDSNVSINPEKEQEHNIELKENEKNSSEVTNSKNTNDVSSTNNDSNDVPTFEDDSESLERKILRLNEEGFEDLEIARKLGIGVGEVKLIIELFKSQNKN
ncbi:MAG: hypothetical protein PWQ20_324 [Thermotogaceae bacterium]|nr:hypothetical protein [Thermotogaceae bacterium]MDN5337254.1 hypothetical protein [Thermotogaceae bacterium]